MRKHIFICLCLVFAASTLLGQDAPLSSRDAYLAQLKRNGRSFSDEFYPNYARLHRLPEKAFVSKIDSARQVFEALLEKHAGSMDSGFVKTQSLEIKYYFDRLLLEYPESYAIYAQSKRPASLSAKTSRRLRMNLGDFNKPELLSITDFTDYAKYYIRVSAGRMPGKPDNKTLHAVWKLIPTLFTDAGCREYWQSEYLFNHIDNNGISNIGPILADFRRSCKNSFLLKKVNDAYAIDSAGRIGHLVKTYKSVEGADLNLHLFMPDTSIHKGKRPVFIYFHGGSWSEGKPDWGFSQCESYSKKGWVGVAVEYRTVSRHGSLPFQSVMDARSAVRWLRANADTYRIDTARIAATGNSAGGHLVLAAALAGKWNEPTDDLSISAAPNALIAIAGAYDLTIQNTMWIGRGLKNKETVKEISPNHLVGKTLPPLMIVHGTADQNCPYPTAEAFRRGLEKGSSDFAFYPLEGAGHFVWYDPKYSGKIATWRQEFLSKLGYPNP